MSFRQRRQDPADTAMMNDLAWLIDLNSRAAFERERQDLALADLEREIIPQPWWREGAIAA